MSSPSPSPPSVESFAAFLSEDEQLRSFGRCVRDVNLLRLGQELQEELVRGYRAGGCVGANPQVTNPRVAIVVDAENCLDRLYGGFFCDWSCGGQWAHMLHYLHNLVGTMQRHNLQLAFFLCGAHEPERFETWRRRQLELKENTARVLKHICKRGTPPPKAWWIPPCALHSMLRLALKTLNCLVFNSVEDHHQELMGFCWENGYHAVMADDAEYAIVSPPRFFSAKSLKMTFQVVLDEVARSLDLNPNRFCLLGALLGNHILSGEELADFHKKLAPETFQPRYKLGADRIVRAVVKYIRALPKIDDFDQLGKDAFGDPDDPRVAKLKASVQYYTLCTQEGYVKTKAREKRKKKYPTIKLACDEAKKSEAKTKESEEEVERRRRKEQHAEMVERIALDLDNLELDAAISAAAKAIGGEKESSPRVGPGGDAGTSGNKDKFSSMLEALASGAEVEPAEEGKYPGKKDSGSGPSSSIPDVKPINIPEVHQDVFRTALERHRQAQMSPYIFQLLTRGEIKLPVLLEDHHGSVGAGGSSIPPLHQLYQPLRQNVYAVLFNVHHLNYNRRQAEEAAKANRRKADDLRKQAKKCEEEDKRKAMLDQANILMEAGVKTNESSSNQSPVVVREWLPYNDYAFPHATEAAEIGWAVPTVQRLWFGAAVEDKQRRLRAFLSCMRCDGCQPLMQETSVPQHMILLACVLRYIMTCQAYVVLSKPELDALLSAAFSPELRDPRYLAELKLDCVTRRGIEISTMVMQGLEMALLANDACGAPVPAQMCLPWTFFDGKLFHAKLRRAETARNLMELCDGRMDIVYAVERMRAAVLDGMVVTPATGFMRGPYMPGPRFQPMPNRSGRLVVGGSVVGQWGPNPGQQKKKKNKANHKANQSTEKPEQPSEAKKEEEEEEEEEGEDFKPRSIAKRKVDDKKCGDGSGASAQQA